MLAATSPPNDWSRIYVRRIRAALIAWFAMLGLDFLLNGAVFARIYQDGGAFMLAPAEAFRRIPLGYLAFLIVAFGIVELTHRLGITQPAAGIRLGLVLGAVVGAVWALSLYSIATLSVPAALAFAVVWVSLLVVGSGAAAASLGRSSQRKLVLLVAGFDLACVIAVVALQSLGIVPTVRL